MPSGFEGTFERRRKEWTARKHRVLGQYVKVAIAKLSRLKQPIALVDGYAGANKYGDEEIGSTRIMLEQARNAIDKYGWDVRVYACEPDPETFLQLEENLRDHIQSGLLRTFNKKHSDCVSQIQQEIQGFSTVVFLDPNAPSQMTVLDDILPWAQRPVTDILGLYFGGPAARIARGALKTEGARETAKKIFDDEWQNISSQDEAFDHFFKAIERLKKYAGLYKVREIRSTRIVYGIFGLSDNHHGYWLLSDAVARDFAIIRQHDQKDTTLNMFAHDADYSDDAREFAEIKELIRQIVEKNPTLTGEDIALEVLKQKIGVEKIFGKYLGRDFTRMRNEILGKRVRNAKTD